MVMRPKSLFIPVRLRLCDPDPRKFRAYAPDVPWMGVPVRPIDTAFKQDFDSLAAHYHNDGRWIRQLTRRMESYSIRLSGGFDD